MSNKTTPSAADFKIELVTSLQGKARMDNGQISAIVAKFEKGISRGHDAEQVFRSLHEAWGNSVASTDELVDDVTRRFEQALEKANLESKPISLDQGERVRAYIQRLTANLKKMEVLVGPVDVSALAEHQRFELQSAQHDRAKGLVPQIPSAFTARPSPLPHQYEAKGQARDRQVTFGVSWIP